MSEPLPLTSPSRGATSSVPAPITVMRAALLAVALLVPLCFPASLPEVRGPALHGWSAASQNGELVVTRTMRDATVAGLLPGDVIIRIDGQPADSQSVATVRANAGAGDVIGLEVRRGGVERLIRIPVGGASTSFVTYVQVRVGIAIAAWILALALITWRGTVPAALALAAALLLLPPALAPSGVTGESWTLRVFAGIWQTLASANRTLIPVLLVHTIALHGAWPRLRDRRIWYAAYAVQLLLLAVTTHGFVTPLAWRLGGVAADVRLFGSLGFQVGAVVMLALIRLRHGELPRPARTMADGFIVVLLFGAALSAANLIGPPESTLEPLRRYSGLSFMLLPVAGVVQLVMRHEAVTPTGARRREVASLNTLLTTVYALAVAGIAAFFVSLGGEHVHGREWLLFAGIFVTALALAPLLRLGRELVDRHAFERRVALEQRIASALERIGAELEPQRVTRRIVRELTAALHAREVTLELSGDMARRLGMADTPNRQIAPPASDSLPRRLPDGTVVLPVCDPHGDTIAVLRIALHRDELLDDFGDSWFRTLATGVSAALRTAASYQQLRSAQAELSEAERIAATGALATGLAHEIKNPLAGLRIGLHLIEREGASRDRLDRILADLRRVDDLVSNLLERRPERDDDVTDIGAVLDDAIIALEPLAHQREVVLNVVRPAGSVHVRASRQSLRLLVSNLVRNAIDAVEPGGRIEVQLDTVEGSTRLSVRDNGAGIPPDEQPRIFELHYSTKADGSGLGLALARREVERLGGTIRLDSAAGRGTTLCVHLPSLVT